MVFPDDKVWRQQLLRANCHMDNPDANVRYRSWGTEELLIRLVRKNMPWLRRICVILARESQVQRWMKKQGVHVVFHKDFIPEEYLPTYNSRGIEMFLKDIPGLSEYFLYGNDDMFPLSPLREEDFFIDGLPCLKFEEKPLPELPNQFHRACMCGLNFVAEEFGMHYDVTWLKGGHSIAPMLKSTCEHLWKRGANKIRASITPFREEKNFNQYIYSWWQYLSADYVKYAPESKYVSVKNSLDEIGEALAGGGIVCVNDNECEYEYKKYAKRVQECISSVSC